MSTLWRRGLLWWESQSATQRRLLLVLAVAMTITAVGLLVVKKRDGYTELCAGVTGDDLTAISQLLNQRSVPYKINQDNSAILVPEADAPRLRLELAAEGLPSSSSTIGFEKFDNLSLFSNDFTDRINYLRALQGELARSIVTLAPVAHARVHLALPEKAVFARERQDPTAAVVLELKTGQALSRGQAQSIAFLVSKSVEGLKPENVHLTDTEGRILWAGTGLDSEELSAEQLQVSQAIERRLQAWLDRTLGLGLAAVSVQVELQRQRRETEEQQFEPGRDGKGILRTESETIEDYTGVGEPGRRAGPAGTASNLALAGGSATGDENKRNAYNRTERQTEYEVSRHSEKMWLLPGEIKRLGVGVLVSDEVEADTLTALSEAIKAAAGIDEKRGDYLAVVPMAFGGGEIPPLPATEKYEFYKRLARYGLTFLSVLIALAMMRSVLLSFRPQSGLPADAEALAGEQLLLLPESPPLEPAEPGVTRGPPSTQLKQAFRQASEVRSDDVADILRIWLREDSG